MNGRLDWQNLTCRVKVSRLRRGTEGRRENASWRAALARRGWNGRVLMGMDVRQNGMWMFSGDSGGSGWLMLVQVNIMRDINRDRWWIHSTIKMLFNISGKCLRTTTNNAKEGQAVDDGEEKTKHSNTNNWIISFVLEFVVSACSSVLFAGLGSSQKYIEYLTRDFKQIR